MDSAPAGATRMGSRSSTRHGGPAQVFVGPVRKWRKVWSPVNSSSPSPSAARVLLYKWNPLTLAASAGGTGAKEDSIQEEATTNTTRPVKFIPIQVLIQKEEMAKKAAEEAEALEALVENENQEPKDATSDMAVDPAVTPEKGKDS